MTSPPPTSGPARAGPIGEESKAVDAEAAAVATELRDALLRTPNLPSPDAPDGLREADNQVIRIEGFDGPDAYGPHQRVPHWDIGAELGILDLEAGARLSGSMFPLYRGEGARLVRALCQLALDLNRDAYEEIRPPTLVRTETMVSTGHLPKFEDDAYHLERDDLWAIPTAEVPLTSLGRDHVYDEADLPVRLMAHTSCFRREAGSAGRDTRGLLRVHEFDKVEILAYATEAQAADVHADILRRAEAALSSLGLAYRVLDLCAGDLGASSARTFDLEVYAPGCDMWLEASSVSWFSDYQARRANIRYRPARRRRPRLRHGRGQHPQRLRLGRPPGVGGGGGDPSPAGRLDRHPRRPPALLRRRHRDHFRSTFLTPLPSRHDSMSRWSPAGFSVDTSRTSALNRGNDPGGRGRSRWPP